ncbi:MAG: TetR family transcriptional regulator [Myxococcota bacterium]
MTTQATIPPPPSRRARKKERTRLEIYHAAMGLFAKRGFDGVTIEQICEAADVARGTFFLHFPCKAALLFEFSRSLAGELRARLAEPRASAAREFRDMVELVSERWHEDEEVMRAMLREFFASRESLAAARDEGRELRDAIEDIVQRGQRLGEFRRSIDPRLAATLFLSTSCAILSGSGAGRSLRPAARRRVREGLLDVVLGGLLDPEGPPEVREME